MKYWTYIILTVDNTLYTGIALDVEKRFQEHLSGVSAKGAIYTNPHFPLRVVYNKEFESYSLAMKEEYRIKHLSRKEKLELCGLGEISL